ncbi:OmpA family protein [Polycyclovorans algicola]|uniref:OmpA family protein n=1 Tax=Polycyclovorans algicola TaxID=616992 RepID=UPI0004A72594|nr:OmpA family protein [Polycyclovorans algicola]
MALPVHAVERPVDCENVAERAQAIRQARDVAGLQRLARGASACDSAVLEYVGQLTAQAMWNALLDRAATATDPAVFEPDLRAILEFGQVWQAHEVLGDIAAARKQHAEATLAYQSALTAIDDETWTPRPPEEARIATLFRKAETQRLLAPTYVANTRSRNDQPSGLGAAQVSRFAVKRTAIPVQFEFGKANFTLEGEKAADDLLFMVRAQGPKRITLVGHTDPVGSEAANQVLSERRAKAVADYLRRNGYTGEIVTLGKGKSQPHEPDDPDAYTVPERHQMDRRVELIR